VTGSDGWSWLRPWRRRRLRTETAPEPRPASGTYKILLDVPSRNPVLGFPESASALARIATESEPRFAIGVFGGWGSGKTTLMRAIEERLDKNVAVPVRFTAWRYEKEEHLIVPLLDTVREALIAWSEERPDEARLARETAATVGRVMKSIVAGLSLKVGVPGAIDFSFDANRALTASRDLRREAIEARVPRSFYHASFKALESAFETFIEHPPRRRIVVFVDDLDRCLPESALQVLESMKLFFDLEGFVFVVGLDEEAIKYIVASKFKRDEAAAPEAAGAPLAAQVTGEDYVKKIFQLPYALAPVAFEQLDEFLEVAYEEAGLTPEQRRELGGTVRPHLRFVVRETSVNPREIKRYINSYIVLTQINPGLNKDAVLALQTVAFREDWREVRDATLEYGAAFIDAARRRVVEGEQSALLDLDPDLARIPQGFLDYVSQRAPAHPLLTVDEIDKYIYTGEAVRSARNRKLLDAIRRIADVRRQLREAGDGPLDVSPVLENVSVASGAASSLAAGLDQELLMIDFEELKGALSRLQAADPSAGADASATRARIEELTQAIRNRLLASYRAGDIAGTQASAPQPPPTSEAARVSDIPPVPEPPLPGAGAQSEVSETEAPPPSPVPRRAKSRRERPLS